MFLVDSLAVGQKIEGGVDERVILFVKLLQEQTLSDELERRIKDEIRARRSPRHVPTRVRNLPPLLPWQFIRTWFHFRTFR